MKALVPSLQCLLSLLAVTPLVVAAEPRIDIRRSVPNEAFLAIYGKHNEERDFQRKYLAEVCETVEETEIVNRFLEIITSRVPENELEEAKSVFDELKAAVEPVDLQALLDCQEVVYAQTMKFPSSQHLVLMRLTPEAAASCEQAIKNLFELAEKKSDGEIPVKTEKHEGTELTSLDLPQEVPFRPAVARLDDIVLFSSSEEVARQSLSLLTSTEGQSKFDDPRLKEALSRLPEPEDSLAFYDGKHQFEQMRQFVETVSQQAGDNDDAKRWIATMDEIFEEVSILDYEVTVEYTEENRNRKATLGKLLPGYDDKLLSKVFGSGQAFDRWDRWVPADARSYSLNTGANLHALYDGILSFIKEHIPEAEDGLEQLEEMQEEFGVHLDRDILQAFSGECVSVSFPAKEPTVFGGESSLVAMRCQKPDRIRELLHRLVDTLKEIPAVQTQQLAFEESKDLEGFEVLSASMLSAFGVQPTIGVHDGWMILGSNPSAVETVLETLDGEGETIADTEAFRQFQLDVEGPVQAISYTNLAASTRRVAMMLNQVGAFVPAIIGMAGAQADPEDLKPVQEALALLPDVAKIVAKFDYLEAKMSLTQDTDQPGTYLRHSVVLVRPE